MIEKLSILIATALLLFCSHIGRSAENVMSSENPTPSLVGKTANETGGKLTYKVNADQAGNHDIILWQCAAKRKDGSLQDYKIIINGTQKVVAAGESGWSFLTLPSIWLEKGTNLITIVSDLHQIPAIEFIRVVNTAGGKSKSLAAESYDKYIAKIREGIKRRIPGIGDTSLTETDSLVSATLDPDADMVPYSFSYFDIPWFGYTFYTSVYLKEGQPFHCVSEAQGGQRHFIEIFSAESPDPYSWTKVSQNGKIDYTIKSVPHTGIYFVRVRTYKNGSAGLCSLNINDEMFYEEVPMCSMGVRSNFAVSTDEYNVFTANSKGDPFLCINKGNDFKGVVYSYNDDYVGDGDYDWGLDARIKRTFSTTANTSRILVFSAASYEPIGACELYVGCKNYIKNDIFLHLKPDDAMVSAPASTDYKCIGWTGGMTNYPWWPSSIASPYNVSIQDTLTPFDRFYARQRYPGCTRYTREGATEENSVIDLWGIRSDSPSVAYVFNHASIRHTSDENHHGYDWESKLGGEERIFHPRYAVENSLYGKVLFHYRISDDSPENPITLDMALAEDKAVMDNIELADGQVAFLSDRISSIANEVVSDFNKLYTAWENVWNHTLHSNPELIKKDGAAYENLRSYCQNTDAAKYLVYDKLNRGISSSVPLFEDLYVAPIESNRTRLLGIHRANDNQELDEYGRQIIRTPLSNLKRLLNQLIPTSPLHKIRSEKSDSSLRHKIEIRPMGESVCLSLALPYESNLTIDLLDHKGEYARTIIHNQNIPSGNYSFSVQLSKGKLNLVRISINGNVVVKKIIPQ